ncbi:transcriptional activator protein [Rutstroemia sp. NJR-2017a WRK4]|nr:transcriptional activator protein [Rutstroemia sp. NJR-2017a WRK4]
MSASDKFPDSGLLLPNDSPNDNMGKLAHAVLDDIFYNIVHDIVLQTHREEKIAKACSAAIIVEQKVAETNPPSPDDGTHATITHQVIETDAAKWENKEVFLKGNPLELVKEIRCAKCGLPRLLQPTDGIGAKRPEPGKEYCKKKPFIEKAYHDVYGQTYVPEGPGRGKKKKDMINPLLEQQAKEGTPGSMDGEDGAGPAKPIAFPHAKCHNCNTFLPIKRMNNHMVKCIGGGGRDSSRNALWKITNGNGNGTGNNSQNGTPPASRHSTPIPNGLKRSSPNKREAGDDPDFESDSPQKKKKFLKKPHALVSKNKLKAPKMSKSASQISTSNLSFEHKINSDEEEDDVDDDRDGEYGHRASVEPKKKMLVNKGQIKKSKEGVVMNGEKKKKKLLLGKNLNSAPILKPGNEPPDGRERDREREREKKKNGNGHGHGRSNGNGNGNRIKREEDSKSESSQTLSSPN